VKKRPLYLDIWKELSANKAMVFLAGPRQAGKTTISRQISKSFSNRVYFNWDLPAHKQLLLKEPAFFEAFARKDTSKPLVILDEIHKYRRWKNYLKGIYDGYGGRYRFLVLGSGRLNVFQRGGDSLAGRYFQFTLWPFTLAELAGRRRSFRDFLKDPLEVPDATGLERTWKRLSKLSGFPEPYLSGRETVYRRWASGYRQQLIREDIRNATEIKNIDDTDALFSLLPSKVGSPLSMDSLARDLQVSFNSIRDWLAVFEAFFLVFRISPWTQKISRAIVKEKKLYCYDPASVSLPAARFENMVALELFRAVSNWNELGLGDFELHYVRNRQKEEVDFLISKEKMPFLLVETKTAEEHPAKSLLRFQTMLDVPAVQLVDRPGLRQIRSNGKQQVLVVTASHWLAGLP